MYMVRNNEAMVSSVKVKQSLRKRKNFRNSQAVDEALGELADAGYLRMVHQVREGETGRPLQPAYELHPDLLKRKAEAPGQTQG